MFGERTIPSVLIGFVLGFVLWIIAGTAMAIIPLPASSDVIGFLIGFAGSVGIGLHSDMTDRKNKKTKEEAP